MRIAVWRHGLPFQTDGESKVGGGRLAIEALRLLVRMGHAATLVGRASEEAAKRAWQAGVEHRPDVQEISEFDAALVLTGPSNPLYEATGESLRRLSRMRSGQLAVYGQWDVALPIDLRGGPPIPNLRFVVLSQTSPESSRPRSKVKLPFEHVRCLWELLAFRETPLLDPAAEVVPSLAYFGSDRPGRIQELQRWFRACPEVHLFGRWSPTNLNRLRFLARGVRCEGGVPEEEVVSRLNGYAATLYCADPEYVKTDFVAQRFIECAQAGVATLYSDRIQPTVREVVPPDLVMGKPEELAPRVGAFVEDAALRRDAALRNRAAVFGWAANNRCAPESAFRELFG